MTHSCAITLYSFLLFFCVCNFSRSYISGVVLNGPYCWWGDKTRYLKNVRCSGEPKNMAALTLKGPGFFVYLTAGGGGGGFRPPPPDLGRGATKNSEIWHVRRVSQYERADEIVI